MATAFLFIGWNHPHVGMHKEAYGFVMGEGRELLAKWKKETRVESSEMFALTAHGGDLNGFITVKGERAKLDELRRTDEFERFSMRMSLLFDRYGVVPGVTEEGLTKVMARSPEFK